MDLPCSKAADWVLNKLLGGLPSTKPVDVMGCVFPMQWVLAAGLDKNADAFEALGRLGFRLSR